MILLHTFRIDSYLTKPQNFIRPIVYKMYDLSGTLALNIRYDFYGVNYHLHKFDAKKNSLLLSYKQRHRRSLLGI